MVSYNVIVIFRAGYIIMYASISMDMSSVSVIYIYMYCCV